MAALSVGQGLTMNSMTQPVGLRRLELSNEDAVRESLDLLASGGCEQSVFLRSVQERFHSEPDVHWEVLSQLDQYYRRGKIKPEVFQSVKMALAGSALRGTEETAANVTVPAAINPTVTVAVAASAAAQPLEIGDVLRNRYRIEGILGRGGMGTVFEAEDDYRLDLAPNGRRLAIKVLHTAVTQRAELLNELRREFQHVQLLSHPNIVRVYEFDRDGPLAFFSMELLKGILLSRLLITRKRLPLPRANALTIIRDVGAAVAHAHSRGVMHGDINPQNIFLTTRGEVKILDFGASHQLIAATTIAPGEAAAPFAAPAFATPGYASCQVLEGQAPDARDDVFALACVAYLLFSGSHAFSESSAVAARAAGSRPARPAHLTNGQWRALRSGLRWEREERPADMQQWLDEMDLGPATSLPPLSELLDAPMVRKKDHTWAAVFLLIALGLAGVWAFTQVKPLPSMATLPTESIEAAKPADVTHEPSAAPETAAAAAAAPEAIDDRPPTEPAARAPSVATSAPVESVKPTAPAAPSKIEMAAATVEVSAQDKYAHISVRRKGNLHGEVGFTWWTESGTAKPGIDFAPVVPQVEHIEDGKSTVILSVPLSATARAQPKSFYVVIDQPEGNAKLGAQTLAMISLSATN
jgi:eukaryotic-like serine/threonine-protein kinase